MDEKMDYRIGLDIGIASVGWAVLQNNSNDEPIRIVDLGVRIFDTAEIPKTGESLAGPREQRERQEDVLEDGNTVLTGSNGCLRIRD